MNNLRSILADSRVLPVVTPLDVPSTLALARALANGGMRAIEVTLRRESALEAIRVLKEENTELVVAAGTVTNPAELDAALEAGADFVLSPGATPALLKAAAAAGAGLVPGVASASEVMAGLDAGYDCFKLFPAEALGGVTMLKSLAGPFPGVTFCPTGGLNPDNFRDYLALDNVICCGGSWMVASGLVENGDWSTIETLARAAMCTAPEGE